MLHSVPRVAAPLITGLDTRKGEQAKSNISVKAVSVKLGLKGNENGEKEILQIGGRGERECWSFSVKRQRKMVGKIDIHRIHTCGYKIYCGLGL